MGSGYDCEVYTHLGAGAYICGEESALLNSLEGYLGQPRVRPPFPAQKGGGLYKEATVVNNVETLANVPFIMSSRRGCLQSDRHRAKRRQQDLLCQRPCEEAGQLRAADGHDLSVNCSMSTPAVRCTRIVAFKAMLPSGGSGPIVPLTDEVLDTPNEL